MTSAPDDRFRIHKPLGLALVPYSRRMLRGAAGAVLHRSLERYGPAAALVQLVAAAAAQMKA
jgi:hypothetical protein